MLSNKFMIVSIFASLAATFLSAIALISTSTKTIILTDLNWGYGDSTAANTDYYVYIGVWALGFKGLSGSDDSNVQQLKYSASDCTQSFCDVCHRDMPIIIGFLAAFCFLSLLSIFTNFARYHDNYNTHRHRNTGIGTSILAIGCGVVSLVLFARNCYYEVQDSFPGDYKWYYGTAWILLIAAVGVKVVDVVFNILVGVASTLCCW